MSHFNPIKVYAHPIDPKSACHCGLIFWPERHGSPHIGQERHANPHIRH